LARAGGLPEMAVPPRHGRAMAARARAQSFFYLLPVTVRSVQRARSGVQPWRPEEGVSAATVPLAGARVHSWVSAPPSSGRAVVH
jgi:hypothetical protein